LSTDIVSCRCGVVSNKAGCRWGLVVTSGVTLLPVGLLTVFGQILLCNIVGVTLKIVNIQGCPLLVRRYPLDGATFNII
jgi:hypothetical protein